MEQFYLIIIAVVIVGALLLIFALKPDLAKKYWAYIAAGAAVVGGVVFAFAQRKQPAPPDPKMQEKENQLHEDLKEVHAEAEAQIQTAREQEAEVHQEVEEIKQIDDRAERLRRLSDLFNRTRR